MALKRCRLLALLLLLCFGLAAGACRSTTLCEQGACVESGEPAGGSGGKAGGGKAGGGKAGGGGGVASSNIAGRPAEGGAAGQEAEAGAGGAGAPAGLMCPDGFADCDGSKFTGCEANLQWNNRHCGACGKPCQGGCQGGRCLEALRFADDLWLTSMVGTRTVAFGLASGAPDLLLRIAITEGTMQELARVPWLSELALGSDRVYVWDDRHDETESGLFSMDLAGTELHSEPLQGADSFGASEKGAYYVELVQDPETVDDVHKLWFRPRADAAWELLKQGITTTEIIASSNVGVVLRQWDAGAATERLYLLDGRDVVDYGLEPEGSDEAIATEGGITVLSSDSEQSRLSWLKADGTSKQYVLSSQPIGQFRKLHVFYDEVALSFEEDGVAFAQHFDEDGLVRGHIGLPRTSELAGIDAHYIWHSYLVNWFTPRFTRSTWFEGDP